jgi:hypothetical protein
LDKSELALLGAHRPFVSLLVPVVH